MKPISFERRRLPPEIIFHAVWLYFGFTMSLRDVEDLLAKRGIDVTYETVRCWANKFGPESQRTFADVEEGRIACGISMRWWSGSAANT